ncbi:DUF397 domain-containing protein [Streptomyces sp. TRM 70361]|uniref:DUF397 domain-containing protein n=1 Tax=Streptomyces sp. TRM 70361 TaxID=3116553 RepID=UPI002E7B77E0|nr:DUF397 domain-containing protein [Streptomyces sp. TRM 70361]MEE1938583.1 DUF397 domain-containing protein [Streptomyces sp. TRM 70361]
MTTGNRTLAASDITADWFRSSYSSNGQNCVETADLTRTAYGAVAIRDSKAPGGPALLFTARAFTAFVAGVKADGPTAS